MDFITVLSHSQGGVPVSADIARFVKMCMSPQTVESGQYRGSCICDKCVIRVFHIRRGGCFFY